MTTLHSNADIMADHDLEQKIARIKAQFPLRSRPECSETLEIVNDDVEQAIFWRLSPISRTYRKMVATHVRHLGEWTLLLSHCHGDEEPQAN